MSQRRAPELGVRTWCDRRSTQDDGDSRSSPHNLPHCTILPIQLGFGKLRHKALALRRALATSRRFRGARIAKILRAEGVETDRGHRRTSAFGLRRLGMMARPKSSKNPRHALAAVRRDVAQHTPLTLRQHSG